MRMILVLAVTAAALLLNVRAGQAYEGPWCATMDIGAAGVTEDCSIPSYELCLQLTIAGNRGFCARNPRWPGWYSADDEPRSYRHRRHRRHRQN